MHEEDDLTGRLLALLREICTGAGAAFSGVGVLVCDAPAALPLVPLRTSSAPPIAGASAAVLSVITRTDSEYHDGFHVLSSNLEFLLVSQFFSPPPNASVLIDRSRPIGGRYVAAQLGSKLPDVTMSGVVSVQRGISIFQAGALTVSEEAP